MQALGTTLASDGMEACRRCCGGHGYSLPSGLPTLFASYVQNATWEGDNNVLYLQVPLRTSTSPGCLFGGRSLPVMLRSCLESEDACTSCCAHGTQQIEPGGSAHSMP